MTVPDCSAGGGELSRNTRTPVLEAAQSDAEKHSLSAGAAHAPKRGAGSGAAWPGRRQGSGSPSSCLGSGAPPAPAQDRNATSASSRPGCPTSEHLGSRTPRLIAGVWGGEWGCLAFTVGDGSDLVVTGGVPHLRDGVTPREPENEKSSMQPHPFPPPPLSSQNHRHTVATSAIIISSTAASIAASIAGGSSSRSPSPPPPRHHRRLYHLRASQAERVHILHVQNLSGHRGSLFTL